MIGLHACSTMVETPRTRLPTLSWIFAASGAPRLQSPFRSAFAKADDIFVPQAATFAVAAETPFFTTPDSNLRRHAALAADALTLPASHSEIAGGSVAVAMVVAM